MPNLRKSDFERIAAIVADLRAAVEAIATDAPQVQESRRAQAFDSAARSLSKALSRHSGTFDANRFLAQCGVKGIR